MRGLLLLLALAAAAAGVWVMMTFAGDEPPPTGMERETEVAGEGPGEGMTGGSAGRDVPGDMDRAQVEVEPGGGAGTSVRVLVTSKEGGEPLPGAEVTYFEYFDVNGFSEEEAEEYLRLSRDTEKLARRYGSTVLADGHGVAAVEVRRGVLATARHGQMYGWCHIRRDPQNEGAEYRLELDRDLTLRVRVVDAVGEPAEGVVVEILPRWADGRQWSLHGLGGSRADGLVTVRHFQDTLSRWKEQEPYPIGHVLRARIPGWTEGGELFDGEDPPDEPIVLRLPPTGRVVVEATDRVGRRVPRDMLDVVTLDTSGRGWTGQIGEDGVTVFDRVVAGMGYVASANVAGRRVEKAFAGPSDGQEVVVTLASLGEIYTLSGRVLDEEGRSVRAQVRVRYGLAGGDTSGRVVSTTLDGTFRFGVNVTGGTRGVTLSELVLEEVSNDPVGNRPVRMYTLAADRPLVPGDNDLGDLVMAPGPLVVSGSVLVDGEVADGRKVDVVVQTLDPAVQRWRPTQLAVRYPQDDRFEVRGAHRQGRHRLYVNAPGYLPVDPVEFLPGAEDVLIDVRSGGSLRAVVLADDALTANYLWLRLVPTEGQVSMEELDIGLDAAPQFSNRLFGRVASSDEGAYEFLWSSLWPGTYRLEVLPRGAVNPLVSIGDIRIASGQQNEDPRLHSIDLRGKLRRIRVQVVDAAGNPVVARRDGRAVVLIDHGIPDARMEGFEVRDTGASILTGEPFLNLLVVGRGFRPKEVQGVSSDTTVTLEAFPEVVVKISGGRPELPEGVDLMASVYRTRGEADSRRFAYESGGGGVESWLGPYEASGEIDERGEVVLQVTDDGNYAVRVVVRDSGDGLEEIEGVFLSRVDRSGEQRVFHVSLPEEELGQALQRLRDG